MVLLEVRRPGSDPNERADGGIEPQGRQCRRVGPLGQVPLAIHHAEEAERRVLARAPEARWDPNTELSDDPLAASWQLAAIAPLGEYDRYSLLQSESVGALLRQTIDATLDAEILWSAE